MQIKNYHSKYVQEVTQLIYHTIWTINSKGYTREQLSVWAKNFKNLDTTWDISTTDINEFKSTCIWNTGFKVFTMIKDNDDYLFKITSASNTNSYIKPINNSETTTETTN